MNNKSLGVLLGLVLGIFGDVLILVFLSSWYGVLVVPMIVPVAIGIPLGIAIMSRFQPLSKRYALLIIVLGFILIMAPYKYVNYRLSAMADHLPMYPGSTLLDRSVVGVCADNDNPWISSTYHVPVSGEKFLNYLKDEYKTSGWVETQSYSDISFINASRDQKVSIGHDFSSGGYTIHLEVAKFCGMGL